jgi:serine protease Do
MRHLIHFWIIVLLLITSVVPAAEKFDNEPAMPEVSKDEDKKIIRLKGRIGHGWPANFSKHHSTILMAFTPIAKQVRPSAVLIKSKGKAIAMGAVVGSEGFVATKASLLGDKNTCVLSDGKELEAKLVGESKDHDLALLKIDAEKLDPVKWRKGDCPEAGSWVIAAGGGKSPMLAAGVVSGKPREIRGSRYLDSKRGFLGVSLEESDRGPVIRMVTRGSAADKAKLRRGDKVLKLNGQKLKNVRDLISKIGSRKPGTEIELVILRYEEEKEFTVKLGSVPRQSRNVQDRWGGGPFSERRFGFPSVLPYDIAVPPNQCGGPLVDVDGSCVGITIARALRVVSYAIPAKTAQKVISDLMKNWKEVI